MLLPPRPPDVAALERLVMDEEEREEVRPGALAPRGLEPLEGGTPAARRRRVEVGGVRRMKWKVRSGRMVMRQGMGVEGW